MIKETMDKKFGAPWHVVAGGYFSYDITFEVPANFVFRFTSLLQWSHDAVCIQCKNLLYIFLGGTTGVLLWKM